MFRTLSSGSRVPVVVKKWPVAAGFLLILTMTTFTTQCNRNTDTEIVTTTAPTLSRGWIGVYWSMAGSIRIEPAPTSDSDHVLNRDPEADLGVGHMADFPTAQLRGRIDGEMNVSKAVAAMGADASIDAEDEGERRTQHRLGAFATGDSRNRETEGEGKNTGKITGENADADEEGGDSA